VRQVLDLRSRVSTSDIRGLLTVTVDPVFPSRPYLYVLYTAAVAREGAPTTNVLSRFTWRGGRLDPSSEKRLVVVPEPHAHAGGQIAFARDGTIFVSTGDAADPQEALTSIVAQDLDQLRGKVLRVTQDGRGVPGNPFWNGDATANRSKVWAYGFRNPFRLTLLPGTETPIVGDVGYLQQDEITAATRGSDNGWSCYEGTVRGPAGYPATPTCRALYAKGDDAVNVPIVSFDHDEAAALTGGTFVPGAAVDSSSRTVYVFADFVHGWLRYLDLHDGRLVGPPREFADGLPGPVALHKGPDGALYYLSTPTGKLRRIERRS
jgi:glucose/arabinose dehydrogenase